MNVQYTPGPANLARVEKGGEKWTLVLVKDLRHPREKVWQALTDPEQLREWAPFEVDGNIGTPGTVQLTWLGTAKTIETKVMRADAPKMLEYGDMRWELENLDGGTRLTLWTKIDRRSVLLGQADGNLAFMVPITVSAGTRIAANPVRAP